MRSVRPAKRVLATTACAATLTLFTAVPALAVPSADNPGQGDDKSNAVDAQLNAPGQQKQASAAATTGGGANQSGPFDSTSDGSPSENGAGDGNAFGKPCAGCVGNADDKNPPGQVKNGNDNGYECDDNNGVGKGNPAHSSCTTGEEPPGEEPPGEEPPGEEPPGRQPPGQPGQPGAEVTPVAQTSAEKSDDSGLAFTGASVLAPAFAGLALLGAGGAAIAVTRRRRID